jgi:hypothetical protein
MICTNCTEAGRLNSELERMRESDLLNLLTPAIELKQHEVEELHKQCANFVDADGTVREEPTTSHCDCHHRTGSGNINRDCEGNATRG